MNFIISILIIEIIGIFVFSLFLFIVTRQILFFGFTPFFPTRPEAMEKILEQLEIRDQKAVYSLSCGRSGFLMTVEKKYPRLKLVGIEQGLLPYLTARAQVFLKRSRIKVRRADFYKADIREANIIFCYLDVKILREIYRKIKVEPKSGAVIISAGFIIPYLNNFKVLKIEDRKRWFSFLVGQHEKILTEKEKEYKRDNNMYFYEV